MVSLSKQYVWQATVNYEGQSKTVSYPLTCEFNITKPCGTDAQHCTLNIYNLAPETRNSELFTQNIYLDGWKNKVINFSVGYEGNISTLFQGVITEAYSIRRSQDVITTIQALDSGWGQINSGKIINITFKAGTSFVEAYNYIASQLINVKQTTRGTLEGTFKTDTTFYGSPLEILNQITNGNTYVERDQLITLNNNENLPTEPILINARTGLIGTPEIRGQWITLTTTLNTNFRNKQRVKLDTEFFNTRNGVYSIWSTVHQGIISAAVGGQRTSTIQLLLTKEAPNSNVNITGQTEKQGEKVVEGTKVYTPSKEFVDNVYNYVKDHNGEIPKWKINNRVSWWNMLGNDNKAEDIYKEITPQIIENCIIIAKKLQQFIDSSELKGKKIQVTSGWRTTKNNAKWGGASNSVHLRGGAIDFYFTDTNTNNAYQNYFKPLTTGWDKFTYYKKKYNIIHVQNTLGEGGARRPRGEV